MGFIQTLHINVIVVWRPRPLISEKHITKIRQSVIIITANYELIYNLPLINQGLPNAKIVSLTKLKLFYLFSDVFSRCYNLKVV